MKNSQNYVKISYSNRLMDKLVTILVLLVLGCAQEYLPKETPIPLSDVFAEDIGRSGKYQFYKLDRRGWSYIYSALPIRPNVITQLTFYMIIGDDFVFGIASLDKSTGRNIRSAYYGTGQGYKYLLNDPNPYGSNAIAGDKITMTIDDRPFEKTLSFAKNGLDMGISYSGFNFWESKIYFYFGINSVGHRVKLVDYKVIE